MVMQDSENANPNGISISEVLHRAAARIDGKLDHHLAAMGLTSRQYLLLKSVAVREGINQIGLTELTGIDRSTMTDMVGRLVTRGLLSRSKNPHDGRAYHVRITENGQQLVAQAMPLATGIDDDLLSRLGPVPREAFVQTLLDICELTDAAERQAPTAEKLDR
jgi:MarR family transcriptional regulator, temperature-dependent positive regulator of motility